MTNKNDKKNLFELPEKAQEKIMKGAIRQANNAQRDLVKRYDKQFGKKATSGC